MTDSEVDLLVGRRKGLGLGTTVILVILAGAGGALAWHIYGNELLSTLGISREEEVPKFSTKEFTPPGPVNGEIVVLVRDLQASQKRIADQLESALQLLNAEQAASKNLTDAVAALNVKLDAFQRPPMPAVNIPAIRRPTPIAPRKPTATQQPTVASPEPVEAEPAGAPADIRR